MSIGTPIDEAGSGGFRVTRRGRIGSNFAMNKDEGRAETVLGSAEGAKRDID